MYADFNLISADNINYTVDMLRLRTNLTCDQFSNLEHYVNTYYSRFIKQHYLSAGISNFKYNYVIEINENSSYWFGFMHNAENHIGKEFNFTVEFNPNKVEIKGLLKYILHLSTNWTIKSIDMAMDVKVNILDICRS